MPRPSNGLAVAHALMAAPGLPHYGWSLRQSSGVRTGQMYRWLQRFLDNGWLADHWETPRPAKRPPRRYYVVTPAGRVGLASFIERNEPHA